MGFRAFNQFCHRFRQEKGGVGQSGSCPPAKTRYIGPVKHLTNQEQLVLYTIIGLLLLGLVVQKYRTAHLPAVTAQQTIR